MKRGEKINQLRIAANLSKEDLAEQVGISLSYLNKIIRGDSKYLNEKIINQFAAVLNCDIEDLVDSELETKEIDLRDPEILPHLSEQVKEIILDPKNAPLLNAMTLAKNKNWRDWTPEQWDMFNEFFKMALAESEKNSTPSK